MKLQVNEKIPRKKNWLFNKILCFILYFEVFTHTFSKITSLCNVYSFFVSWFVQLDNKYTGKCVRYFDKYLIEMRMIGCELRVRCLNTILSFFLFLQTTEMLLTVIGHWFCFVCAGCVFMHNSSFTWKITMTFNMQYIAIGNNSSIQCNSI